MIHRALLPTSLLALSLAGCMGTPHLLEDAPLQSERPSPSIDDVKSEIACELLKFKNDQRLANLATPAAAHFQSAYLVTATLSLQVDDYLDITPTLNFIHPLAAAAETRTVIASADLGGQRERTYTETFYIDTSKLSTFSDDGSYEAYMTQHCSPQKYMRGNRYSLRGDLKLDEIIGNGEKSLKSSDEWSPAVSTNTNPSFGSTVEFIVTRNLTALGAQWSLVHFKGPSGSNGLLNGKKVTTDKLVIAFARTVPPTVSDSSKIAASLDRLTRLIDADLKAQKDIGSRETEKHVADTRLQLLERPFQAQLRFQPNARPRADLAKARTEAQRKQAELASAQAAAAATAQAVQTAKTDVNAAVAETTTAIAALTAVDSAARANEQLQTTMILQTLNTQLK